MLLVGVLGHAHPAPRRRTLQQVLAQLGGLVGVLRRDVDGGVGLLDQVRASGEYERDQHAQGEGGDASSDRRAAKEVASGAIRPA